MYGLYKASYNVTLSSGASMIYNYRDQFISSVEIFLVQFTSGILIKNGYFSTNKYNFTAKLIEEIPVITYAASILINVNRSFSIYNQVNNEEIIDMYKFVNMEIIC